MREWPLATAREQSMLPLILPLPNRETIGNKGKDLHRLLIPESPTKGMVTSGPTGLGIDSSKLCSDGALNTLRLAAATTCQLPATTAGLVCTRMSEVSSSSLVAGPLTPATAGLAREASSSQ
jgi:hypothetical protein